MFQALPVKRRCTGMIRRGSVIALLLIGCAACSLLKEDPYSRTYPPVYHGYHVAKAGETLYSISHRYGRDYRELAAVNRLQPPYKIRSGQRISLAPKAPDPRPVVAAPAPAPAPVEKKSTPKTTVVVKPSVTKPPVAKPSVTKPPVTKPPVTKPPAAPKPAEKSVTSSSPTRHVGGLIWQWPSSGRVTTRFSSGANGQNGIDIAMKTGESVKAASDGEVIYSGNGLRGYGKLLIIKHNKYYLSAYANLQQIAVKEGDQVRRGKVIASVGSTGSGTPVFHFEIRKNGKPVDPLGFLPPEP